ncbi:MAG: DUF2157 domain-containing protein [Rhizobiaceae bacterium]
MAGYLSSVRKDIDRWREAGLIDDATASAIAAEAEAHHRRGFSLGSILALLAAILVGAALLLLIAANWEVFPRLARVAMIFVVILAGYGGGAVLKKRGQHAFAEGLWLLAAIAFGGGIALIGQMYHLSGDEADALLLWGGGTMLAAAALRSGPLTMGAALLAAAWMVYLTVEGGAGRSTPLIFPLLALPLWAISVWTGSVSARHLILMSLMLFAALLYLDRDITWALLLLAAVSAAVFAFAVLRAELAERVFGLGDGLAVQGLLGFITGMAIVQADRNDSQQFLLMAAVVFAGVVAALLLAGRGNRALRWTAYAGFIFELGIVYVMLLDTMLDTSGFFLIAGLTLALLAWLINRVERRIAAPRSDIAGEGA